MLLYQFHELLRGMLAPYTYGAQASAKMFSAPGSWLSSTPGASRVAAGNELLYRIGKDYEKPGFDIHEVDVDGVVYPVVERVIESKPFCRLLRFKRYSDEADNIAGLKDDPTVLVVAPLSGHHSTLLRDTVQTLLREHKVYITDWVDARMVPVEEGAFDLDDYVGYITAFIRTIGARDLHVISVCQPTVPVLAAVSLMAARGEPTPRSLVMMGGPIDTRESPTGVNSLATEKPLEWFENNVVHAVPANYPGRGRQVYPGFLQHTGFVAMNPERHFESHWDFYQDLVRGDLGDAAAHRRFYDEYNAVLDMPAEYYLDTIRIVFQQHLLPRGLWDVAGERVRPAAITGTALMTIEGELDDISGLGQTRAAHALCTGVAESDRHHYTVMGAGHYGIFSGRRWREQVYPQVRDFIASHAAPLRHADSAARKVAARSPRRAAGSSAMPRGDKTAYTDKQRRQAEHIEQGERDKGQPEETAERIGWATVNKQDGGGKASGSGRKAATSKAPAKKAASKKTPSKKTASKKSVSTKPAAKKSASKTAAKKTAVKTTAVRKTAATKGPAKNSAASHAPAKKAPATKTPARKSAAKKATTGPAATKKAPARKSAARKATTGKTGAGKAATGGTAAR